MKLSVRERIHERGNVRKRGKKNAKRNHRATRPRIYFPLKLLMND